MALSFVTNPPFETAVAEFPFDASPEEFDGSLSVTMTLNTIEAPNVVTVMTVGRNSSSHLTASSALISSSFSGSLGRLAFSSTSLSFCKVMTRLLVAVVRFLVASDGSDSPCG